MTTATEVLERPIIMSGEMLRATLDGRKTQTRRVVKIPAHVVSRGIHPRMDEWVSKGNRYTNGSGQYQGGNPLYTGDQPPGLLVSCLDDTCQKVPCPYGHPGDSLYVRERFWEFGCWQNIHGKRRFVPYYGLEVTDRRIGAIKFGEARPEGGYDINRTFAWHRRPSIFLPRAASRIRLEVTCVRVERVQDITPEDAKAEGDTERSGMPEYHDRGPLCHVDWFKHLWDSLNAKRGHGWRTNPWVWVIEFDYPCGAEA